MCSIGNLQIGEFLLKTALCDAFIIAKPDLAIKQFEIKKEFSEIVDLKQIETKKISDLYWVHDISTISIHEVSITETPFSLICRINEFWQKNTFPSKNIYEELSTLTDLYSLFPASNLIMFRFDNGEKIVALIRFKQELLARSPNLRINPLFFTDEAGKVLGINGAFASIFNISGSEINKVLNYPIAKYMCPTPLSLFTPKSDDIVRIINGIRWETTDKAENVLPQSFDSVTENIMFEVAFAPEHLPMRVCSIVLCGDKLSDTLFSDANGYRIDVSLDASAVTIWKQRYPLFIKKLPATTPKANISRISCFIIDTIIGVRFNDGEWFSHKDPLLIQKNKAFIGLILPERDENIAIKSSRIMRSKRRNAYGDVPTVATLTEKKERFMLRQYLDTYTLSTKEPLFCYLLLKIPDSSHDIETMEKAQEKAEAEREQLQLIAASINFDGFVGKSAAILKIKEQATAAAASNLTILIEGETGTGKEVLANYIHKFSPFNRGPLVKIDCSLLPQTLIESELFGYEKGAFTGANSSKSGKFESADGGTIFLDEIGNLDLAVQAKLLHFLQDFTVERLGGTDRKSVNTRIITATNRPLSLLVSEGKFRADLFYRLNAVKITLPPLRERISDIPDLVRYFLRQYPNNATSHDDLSASAYQKLLSCQWHGNIRELQSVIKRAALFCPENIINEKWIDLSEPDNTPTQCDNLPFKDSRILTREHIITYLKNNNYIIKRAASASGVSLPTFFRKIKKFGIKINEISCLLLICSTLLLLL